MCTGRETKDIWWYLFGNYPNGDWRGWRLFTRRFWRFREHLWHDSFGKYWHRLIGCAHPNPVDVSNPGGPKRVYCFLCERDVEVE